MPQPTTMSPSPSVWALPCDDADRPSGWSSEDTRVATRSRKLRLTVTSRL